MMDKSSYQTYQLKLQLNPGVLSNIYSHPSCSVSDFFGFMIGKTKILTNTKVNDQHSSIEQNTTYYIIDKLIFIYNKNNLKEDNFFNLLEKIQKNCINCSILGMININFNVYSPPEASPTLICP